MSKARKFIILVESSTREKRFTDAVKYSVNSEDPKNARIDTVDRAIQNGFIKDKEIDIFLDWLISKGARPSLKDDYHKLD